MKTIIEKFYQRIWFVLCNLCIGTHDTTSLEKKKTRKHIDYFYFLLYSFLLYFLLYFFLNITNYVEMALSFLIYLSYSKYSEPTKTKNILSIIKIPILNCVKYRKICWKTSRYSQVFYSHFDLFCTLMSIGQKTSMKHTIPTQTS